MKIFNAFIILLLMCISLKQTSYAQVDLSKLQKYEDTLLVYADSMLNSFTPNSRAAYISKFVTTLKDALEQKNSFQYPFDSLSKVIHIVQPSDNSFRIFNWVFVASEFQRKYFGAIQMNQPDLKLYPLYDRSAELEEKQMAFSATNNEMWYGGEVYNITTEKTASGNIYNVFSYNNNSYYSKKKIMDLLTFTESGPQFGLPIIHTPQGTINRMIMEYKKEAFANLNYSTDYNKVIFDRLASDVGDPSKRYTFVPTGTLDGLEWRGDGWYFVENAIPVLRLRDGQAPIDGVIPGK